MNAAPTLLVIAKAPVAGQAKTRLGARVGDEAAAQIAVAALLDTLEVADALGWPAVIATTGDLDNAACADGIKAAFGRHRVIAQRGDGFAARLVAAHHDADAGSGIVQIGMDTPQVTVAGLRAAASVLDDHDAGLGLAEDGGWWLLAVRDAAWATCLDTVPMSRPDTGARTLDALLHAGARVGFVPPMTDVDTWDDARDVASLIPHSRFAAAYARAAGPNPISS